MKKPLLVVSNRLPIVVSQGEDGEWQIRPGSGGLVTAMRPVLQSYGGCWVGWPGDAHGAPIAELLADVGSQMGCSFEAVELTEAEVEGYYYGFSNKTLWPLFHDLLGHAEFEQEEWITYIEANRRFAEQIARVARTDHLVWVHDYQLILVGRYLRERGMKNPLAYFLHIPFPPPDIFARLPWRAEIIRAFLEYDSLGFQSVRDLRNFVQCVKAFVPDANIESRKKLSVIDIPGQRRIHAGSFPISIDFGYFDERARAKDVEDAAWFFHEGHGNRHIILGVDRLDYTKGIPSKMRAFGRALEKYPELRGNISLVQLVVPSRQDIPEYQRWKAKLDAIVGDINGRYGFHGWAPLHYMYRSLPEHELLGHYRAAEICLVTPLKDGMNLVAKEYCAACVDNKGILILSEFAGAAAQLHKHALIVNPHDLEGVADAIFRAHQMAESERNNRMMALRRETKKTDIYWWVDSFLRSVPSEPATPAALL